MNEESEKERRIMMTVTKRMIRMIGMIRMRMRMRRRRMIWQVMRRMIIIIVVIVTKSNMI